MDRLTAEQIDELADLLLMREMLAEALDLPPEASIRVITAAARTCIFLPYAEDAFDRAEIERRVAASTQHQGN